MTNTDALDTAADRSVAGRELAVLIVAYRRPDLVANCLKSVREHLPDLEVLVWDNSGFEFPGMDRVRVDNPNTRWFGDGTNRGFAAGVNALAREVPGSDLLLLNPDAELLGPLVATRAAIAAPSVAAVAPLVLSSGEDGGVDVPEWDVAHRKNTLLRAWVSKAGYADKLRGTLVSDLYESAPERVDGYLTGACLAIGREAWDRIGEFDEEFFLYGEEADWQRRARAAGWVLRLVHEPGVVHSAQGTVANDSLGTTRSGRLLRTNVALCLDRQYGSRRGDLYLAGSSLLDRVQRSRRRARSRLPRSEKPSIVFTVNRLVYGGAERQHVVLATELVRRGYPVTIAAMQRFGPLVSEIPHSVDVVRQPWWAPAIDLPPGPSIVVSGDTNTETGFASLWRAAGRHRKWLVAAHIPPKLDGPTYSRPLAAAMRRADGFVALSDMHWREATAHQNLGKRWFTAPNGVASASSLPAASPTRERSGGPLRLVMLSRIVEHKNPHLLVEALDGLQDLQWELSIYGDGPDRERLEALTPEHLRERVRWCGWSPGPEHALAECDLLCVPSRAEAFPLVILEAMARRIPVIASSVCAVPDMLDGGRAGRLVEPITVAAWRTALADVLQQPEALPELGEAGFSRMSEKYTIEAMADAYEEAFQAVGRE
ncbi:glycosyltransferase [Rhodococcus sp. NPDC058521]|uniref:glycosyltransferase n=1 Tax=Rhodococcus sp. NPDC058521 TaxID=3346536 RepID=UPI00364E870A